MTGSIWFVVHKYELWDIDNRIIGFWKQAQWSQLRVGDWIIYYRAGVKRIKGVFRIIKKGLLIRNDFFASGIKERPIYQCALELLSDDVLRSAAPTTDERFSFYHELRSNFFGGRGKQCFKASPDDLQLIIPEPSNLSGFDQLSPYKSLNKPVNLYDGRPSKPTERELIKERKIQLENSYESAKAKLEEILRDYIDLFRFDDEHKIIYYKSEGPLIPDINSRIPVLVLLSNPHPLSVQKGMFLSPNSMGIENPFWKTLRLSGGVDGSVSADANIMINNLYTSRFRFFMAVLLPFPTEDPDHLSEIFGSSIYERMLSEGAEEIQSLILENDLKFVICFQKLQYEAVVNSEPMTGYKNDLISGKLIHDHSSFSKEVIAYLTYPTGWRFHKDHVNLKKDSLRRIFVDILKRTQS